MKKDEPGNVPVMGLSILEVGFPMTETFGLNIPVGAQFLGVRLMAKQSHVLGGQVAVLPHLLMLANPALGHPKKERQFAVARAGTMLPASFTYDYIDNFTYGKGNQLFYLFERKPVGEG